MQRYRITNAFSSSSVKLVQAAQMHSHCFSEFFGLFPVNWVPVCPIEFQLGWDLVIVHSSPLLSRYVSSALTWGLQKYWEEHYLAGNFSLPIRHLIGGNMCFFNISKYFSESTDILSLHISDTLSLHIRPTPFREKQPQTSRFPPPNVTVGRRLLTISLVCSGSNPQSSFRWKQLKNWLVNAE